MDDNTAPFIGGLIFGGSYGLSLWNESLKILQANPTQFLEFFALKLAATLVLGLFGGLVGMAGKDLYRFIKRKIFKRNDF
jgi:hypothetical protein